MITIITGNVDCGKTTALISLFQGLRGKAEGFAIPKCYQSGQFTGQQLLDLQSGYTIPFSYVEHYLPPGQDSQLKYDRFILVRDGLLTADKIIRRARMIGAENIFADEFGPIEQQKQGLWPAYQKLVDHIDFSKTNIYIAVRKACLASCIQSLKLPWREIRLIKI